MSNGRALAAIVCLLITAVPSAQAPSPDFSGTWRIDDAQSGRAVDVWGQTRARLMVIAQSPAELTLATDGGGPVVPGDLQRYRLNGDELVVVDDSLGELENFVRKVRTLALWDGLALRTETETVSESIDPRTGVTRTGRGITSVLTFRLGAGGDELIVERTGFRAQPPAMLHGRPYDRSSDLAYNVDRVRYVRAAQPPR
jgi:hypothetical protein